MIVTGTSTRLVGKEVGQVRLKFAEMNGNVFTMEQSLRGDLSSGEEDPHPERPETEEAAESDPDRPRLAPGDV